MISAQDFELFRYVVSLAEAPAVLKDRRTDEKARVPSTFAKTSTRADAVISIYEPRAAGMCAMRQSKSLNASLFDTHRMVRQYLLLSCALGDGT